jgi:hypothetical protein
MQGRILKWNFNSLRGGGGGRVSVYKLQLPIITLYPSLQLSLDTRLSGKIRIRVLKTV